MKHLNPRQGITTARRRRGRRGRASVKHLNPRQGITTAVRRGGICFIYFSVCETPKSPPGDYNIRRRNQPLPYPSRRTGVKHLNPRQGITTQ